MREAFDPLDNFEVQAMLIASMVRSAMEDFHAEHLSDAQMRKLNPIIRDAIYTALVMMEKSYGSVAAKQLLAFQMKLIPAYWEPPRIMDSFAESLS